MAENKNFDKSQYQFILDKKLKPLINYTKKIRGFNIEKRHPAIKEMLYSVATQHGNKGSADLLCFTSFNRQWLRSNNFEKHPRQNSYGYDC